MVKVIGVKFNRKFPFTLTTYGGNESVLMNIFFLWDTYKMLSNGSNKLIIGK